MAFNKLTNTNGPPTVGSSNECFDRTERRKLLVHFVKELANQAKMDSGIVSSLYISPSANLFNMTPSAGGQQLYFPALFLINIDSDFGPNSEFNIQNLTQLDEKLKDPLWLQRFSNKLCDLFDRDHVSVGMEERESLRLFVRYLEGTDKEIVNGFRFAMLHELGHIRHEHQQKTIQSKQQDRKWRAIGGLASAIITFIVAFFLGASILGLVIAVPLSLVAGVLATKSFQKLRDASQSHKHEKEADLHAAETLSGKDGEEIREGGIYLFNTIKKHQIELRNKESLPKKERRLFKMLFSPQGHGRFLYLTHPNESNRIKKLKDYKPP